MSSSSNSGAAGPQIRLEALNISADQLRDILNTANRCVCCKINVEEFLSNYQAASSLDREKLNILLRITEIIKEEDANQNTTDHFTELLRILQVERDDITVAAALSLLHMTIESLYRKQYNFQNARYVLQNIQFAYATNHLIVQICTDCLHMLNAGRQ